MFGNNRRQTVNKLLSCLHIGRVRFGRTQNEMLKIHKLLSAIKAHRLKTQTFLGIKPSLTEIANHEQRS